MDMQKREPGSRGRIVTSFATRPIDLAEHLAGLTLHSPREMDRKLEQLGYRGQPEARRAVCLMAYRHLRRLCHIHVDGVPPDELPPKSNLLMMGPTGCGKTYLVELLFREVLGLPTVIVDATTLSETGYVGQDCASVLARLLHAARGHRNLAQVGVVCLDEFDKLAGGQSNAVFAGAGTTKDVTGRGVQRELLRMLEASRVTVPLEGMPVPRGGQVLLDTRDIAFVASGAFSGFCRAAHSGQKEERIGFGRRVSSREPERIDYRLEASEAQDVTAFQRFGFMPELIGRFSRIVPFQPLERETLAAIVRDNVLPRAVNEFALEGYELEIDPSCLDHLVDCALERQTGARGLTSELDLALEAVAYERFPAPEEGGRVVLSMHGGEVQVEIEEPSAGLAVCTG